MIYLMRGFAALPLIIVLVIAGVVGLGWYTYSTNHPVQVTPSPSPSPAISPSPSPSPAPVIKKIIVTPKPSPSPSVSPSPSHSPSQTAAAVTGCASYNLGGDLGNVTVNIEAQSGQSLVGDAGVIISRKYSECQGVDPGWPATQIIRQGSTSTNFGGMRPGPFHIEVSYHGNNYGSDINLNSGNNAMNITVSN